MLQKRKWSTSAQENKDDLENTKIICKNGTEKQIHKLWKCKNRTKVGFTWRTKTHSQFAKKNGINDNNLNDLFPENEKRLKMKTGAVEKYEVQHVNTERSKNSSMTALQKMLIHDARIQANW